MNSNEDFLKELKKEISKEKRIVEEMSLLLRDIGNIKNSEEKEMVFSQIKLLKSSFKRINQNIPNIAEKLSIIKPLNTQTAKKVERETRAFSSGEKSREGIQNKSPSKEKNRIKGIPKLEKETVKRLKKGQEEILRDIEIKKPSRYVNLANKIFSDFSKSLLSQRMFLILKKNLIKTNLRFVPTSYISVMLFTTLLSLIAGAGIFLFLLFFNFGVTFPIITKASESIMTRILKTFWVLFAIPFGTFLIMYFYPSLEKKFIEGKINQELPFATIHMASISNSMIEPSKTFSIIISTREYPFLEKEFTKLINEINIYGYDLVSALRNIALNSPSAKLAELFKSMATTINSGGDLPKFFEKRSQTLLFEYRLEREKYTKTAETFMDIYISVVIAAPMILMLLIIMMKISGLGVSLSSSMISLIMVLGVSIINILFLAFLHLKQPGE